MTAFSSRFMICDFEKSSFLLLINVIQNTIRDGIIKKKGYEVRVLCVGSGFGAEVQQLCTSRLTVIWILQSYDFNQYAEPVSQD